MTFLEMKKEAAFILGCLQYDSIVGLNSDQTSNIGKNINRAVRYLIDLRPPFAQGQWPLLMQASTDISSTTGTKNIPYIIDMSAQLKKKDVYKIISDGTYNYRIIDISGTTITLENGLKSTISSSTTFTVYKDTYPLPANLGDIERIVYEDGEDAIQMSDSREEFSIIMQDEEGGSRPYYCSLNFWTNRFNEYKFKVSGVTVANGSRILSVSDSDLFDFGDVIQIDTGTTDNIVATIIGIDETSNKLYLDKNYSCGTTNVTVYVNPNKYTEYITFYQYPSEEKDIKIFGWIKPYDMVNDSDECILREDLCPVAIIHSLLMDKFYSELVSEEFRAYYLQSMKYFKSRKKAQLLRDIPSGWRNRYTYASDFSYPS